MRKGDEDGEEGRHNVTKSWNVERKYKDKNGDKKEEAECDQIEDAARAMRL